MQLPIKFCPIKLDLTTSTNDYASNWLMHHSLQEAHVFYTHRQSSGKGRNGKVWVSEPNKNLLFSLAVNLKIPLQDRFYISKAVALGIKDYVDSLSVKNVSIKWPNDILVGKKKIAGVLIENSITGNQVQSSVIGVGLNVLQSEFPEFEREACSIYSLTELILDFEEILEDVVHSILYRLNQLQSPKKIDQEYHHALYGRDQQLEFKKDETTFKGTIEKVDEEGQLWIRSAGKSSAFDMNSIVFID